MKGSLHPKPRIAFVVGTFPAISETFIINQVADLLDRGFHVEIFTFQTGARQFISSRHTAYRMSERTHGLQPPASRWVRRLAAIPIVFRLLFSRPQCLIRVLKMIQSDRQARPLEWLYGVMPFVGKQFDLVHCHFGDVAVRFLTIKDLLHLDIPLITTFYGYDASRLFTQAPPDFYARLKREGDLFFVMSHSMKGRVLAEGFPEAKIKVLPVSINVDSYPFSERTCLPDKPVQLISVGRFVEKKGFNNLLRALALVRQKSSRAFHCSLVGGGRLEEPLRELTTALGLNDVVDFKGQMKMEDIIDLLLECHIMVQPSKTAANGDRE